MLWTLAGDPSGDPALSAAQLARLASVADTGTASVGDVPYRVGDRTYPSIAIIEGEVGVVDAHRDEIMRYGPAGFLGETNLLTGQTAFVTAVVAQRLRYIPSERDLLRALLFEDGPFSELVLARLMQRREMLEQLGEIGVQSPRPLTTLFRRRRGRATTF